MTRHHDREAREQDVGRARRAFLVRAAKTGLAAAGVAVLATAKPKRAKAVPYGPPGMPTS